VQKHGLGGRPRPVLETRGGAQRFSGSEGRAASRGQPLPPRSCCRWHNGSGGCASPLLHLERGTLIFTMCAMCMPEDGAGAALMPAVRTAECAQPSAPLLSTHAGSHV